MILVENYHGSFRIQFESILAVVISRVTRFQLFVINDMHVLVTEFPDPFLPCRDDSLGTNDEGHKPDGFGNRQRYDGFTRTGIAPVLCIAVLKQSGEQLSRMLLLPVVKFRLGRGGVLLLLRRRR